MPVGNGVLVGGGVGLGNAGLGVGGTEVVVATGEGVGVRLGKGVGVGRSVFVARASTTRVLVGVGVTAGFPGAHWIISDPTRPTATRKNQNHRCPFIARYQTLCERFPLSEIHHSILENRTINKRS